MEKYKQTWSNEYKGISYEMCFWTNESMRKPENNDIYKAGGIWNSYITIRREQIPKEFNSLIGKIKKWRSYITREYNHLHDIFNMRGGITFYKSIFNEEAKIVAFQVGNDYNHIWNDGHETKESVEVDVKESIDCFIRHFPKYKVRSFIDGAYVMPKNLEKHNKKANERLNKKHKKL